MKYLIGTPVLLKHTGDRGIIREQDSDGMYLVRLSDGFDIPAFEDDLQDISHGYHPDASVKAQAQHTDIKAAKSEVIHAANTPQNRKGIYLALEPLPEKDETVLFYDLWIVNDQDSAFVAQVGLFYGEETLFEKGEKLSALSALRCGKIHYDDLNDHPDAEVFVQKVTTQGLEQTLSKTVRLRGKIVINTPVIDPVMDKMVWHIDLFSAKSLSGAEEGKSEDLTEYAKGLNARPKPNSGGIRLYQKHNIREIASFQQDFDLHIEALVAHRGKMSNAEILRIQLLHFEQYMDKASRMSVHNVFIIHGVGEGVLKAAIAERLRSRSNVAKFHNHYHPKYGYGATEVIFK